jgi:ankyrin repeat protein
LLEAGALPNIRDNEHRTALMMASINGHHEIVEKLLKQNADVNDFQKLTDRGADFNPTAIAFAAIGNHLKVISTLLTKAHKPINLRNAMMLAITKKSIDAVKLFLDAGVNPNFEYKSTVTDEYSMEIREVSITPLMHAIQMGNTANTIELLLQRGADPNYSPNNAEFTALMLAVMNGDIGIIQKLTQYGGNLNATIDGNNLLHVAIYADSDKAIVIIEMLLERKVDPAAQNIYGVTPLMLAAVSIDPRVAKLLLKQNPQLDSQNNNGKTALMLSSSCGNIEVVDMLLNKGANPNIQDHNDMTALMFACKANHLEVVERLLECSDIKLKAKNGISAFNLAAYCGNDQLVDAFFEKHTISQDEIAKGIVLACYGGHPTIITLLSEKLTNLTEDQRIMLLSCVCNDLATVTVKILEDGLDPDLPIVCGLTPLMLAASCGHIELVDALIQMGSNVDSQEDFLGCTSLHFAVSGSKSLELVKLLLEDGRADVNVVSDNLTPLDTATLNELNSIVSELKKHGGLTHSELRIQLQQATNVVAHQQEEAKKMSYIIQKNNYDNLAETGLEKVYRIRNDCKNVARKMEITDQNLQQTEHTEVLVY